ncbi:MAG: peptidylprolyl isomerase [Bacteroidetes bacterium HGW-Bacteroidetes-1]|jgi:FKBP-type peptidyl-prolyl cis-trans isomerase SlyD|nr:MAG: peptidylprolyl isomerase [Bacteroidetes bacterium HGW-Bacteroidetes-1]
MVIEKNKVGVLTYSIQIDNEVGEILESAGLNDPKTMLFGTGRLLKSFEERLLGLRTGAKFEFTLTPEDSFGLYREELKMDIPKSAFMVNGTIKPDTLIVGRTIPMMDSEGNPFDGRVIALNGDVVSMDFNHPLAGKSLFTKGEILNVREATYEELNPATSGCGCGTSNESCCGGGEHKHSHHKDHDEEGCGVCGDTKEVHQHGSCNC